MFAKNLEMTVLAAADEADCRKFTQNQRMLHIKLAYRILSTEIQILCM